VSQSAGAPGGGSRTRFRQARIALLDMIRSGRSFSGRERHCVYLNMGLSGEDSATPEALAKSGVALRQRSGSATNGGMGKGFANVSAVSGLDFLDDGRALATADWDHDGDIDLWISNRNAPRLRFMRNDTPTNNQSLLLRLEGTQPGTNRDAVGARVEVVLDQGQGTRDEGPEIENPRAGHSPDSSAGRRIGIVGMTVGTQTSETRPARHRLLKTLRAGEGHIAQSSKWLHFGLGRHQAIESVRVWWPGGNGSAEVFTGVQPGRRYILKQGNRDAIQADGARPAIALEPSVLTPPPLTLAAEIRAATPMHMPALDFVSANDGRRVRFGSGMPVLVNLWASWCAPCAAELAEFARREAEIRRAGIEIVAINLDSVNRERGDVRAAGELLQKVRFPFVAVAADESLIRTFQIYQYALTSSNRALPVPSSFLIDGDGRLVAMYKGSVRLDSVFDDLAVATDSDSERRWVPLGGTAIEHPLVRELHTMTDAVAQFQLGRAQISPVAAIQCYRESLGLAPDFVPARINLGRALSRLGRHEEARRQFEAATAIAPESRSGHINLGIVLEKLGLTDAAGEQYNYVLGLDPKYIPAHINLGQLHESQGDIEAARERYELALKLDPDAVDARNRLGVLLGREGKLARAVILFEQALAVKPDDAESHTNLGFALEQQGDLDGAARHYQRALRGLPDNEQIQTALQRVNRKQQKE